MIIILSSSILYYDCGCGCGCDCCCGCDCGRVSCHSPASQRLLRGRTSTTAATARTTTTAAAKATATAIGSSKGAIII